MSSVSDFSDLSDFSDDSIEDPPLSFLDLPSEIRNMIYEEYLPQTVTIAKENDPELAILSTCHQVCEEAVSILRKRSACHLIIRDRESYQRARSWIEQSGDSFTSTIRTLDIDSWNEFSVSSTSAAFRQYRFSFAFKAGFPGYTVKYTFSGDETVINYEYPKSCHGERQGLPSYLKKVMLRLFGRAHDKPVSTNALKEILESIASYSKWVHEGQDEAYPASEVQRLDDWRRSWAPERRGWVYLYPNKYPNEPAGGYGVNGALQAPGTTTQFKWGRL
ncbi:MAG: hypothetical protein Q9226_006092 [Calogaya cf. arnoldii]